MWRLEHLPLRNILGLSRPPSLPNKPDLDPDIRCHLLSIPPVNTYSKNHISFNAVDRLSFRLTALSYFLFLNRSSAMKVAWRIWTIVSALTLSSDCARGMFGARYINQAMALICFRAFLKSRAAQIPLPYRGPQDRDTFHSCTFLLTLQPLL